MVHFNKLKYFPYIIALLMPCTTSLHALDVELRLNAYFHTGDQFKKAYTTTTLSGGFEISETFFHPQFELWGNFDYFSKHVHSKCCKSRIDAPTISFGPKYSFKFNKFLNLYAGIGPSFAHVTVKNNSCFRDENIVKNNCGIVVKTGSKIHLSRYIFLNLFADYLYQPVNYHKTVDIGGLKLGAGLGVSF